MTLANHYLLRLGQPLRKRYVLSLADAENQHLIAGAIKAAYASCCENGSGEEANVLLASSGLVVGL